MKIDWFRIPRQSFPDSTVSLFNRLFIQVGDREDSNVYIRMKMKNAAEVGIAAQHVKLPRTTTHRQLLDELERLNNDDAVHGIILQVGALDIRTYDMTPFTLFSPEKKALRPVTDTKLAENQQSRGTFTWMS